MSHLLSDPRERFGDRVDAYRRYRPRWPLLLPHLLREQGSLPRVATVADIGAGTGLSCEPFLRAGHRVLGVEPNPGMRHAAREALGSRQGFTAIDGTAEHTGIGEATVDLVVAGQAFHWFDPAKAGREFARILKPGGAVLLMWNLRDTRATPFDFGYESFLEHWGTDYAAVKERYPEEAQLAAFLAAGPLLRYRLPNPQSLDRAALAGRLCSSSYLPGPSHPQRSAMLESAGRLFDTHQRAGLVTLAQYCELFLGHCPRP
jgi:SAM-dependent methyltransferase